MAKWIQLRQAHEYFANRFGPDADRLLINCLATDEIEAQAGIYEASRSRRAVFTQRFEDLPDWIDRELMSAGGRQLVHNGGREVVVRDRSGWSHYFGFRSADERFSESLNPSLWNECSPEWEDNAAFFWRLKFTGSEQEYSYRFYARKIAVDAPSIRKASARISADREVAANRRSSWGDVALALTELWFKAGRSYKTQTKLAKDARDLLEQRDVRYAERSEFLKFTSYFLSQVPRGAALLKAMPKPRHNWDDFIRVEACARALAGQDARSIILDCQRQTDEQSRAITFDLNRFVSALMRITG